MARSYRGLVRMQYNQKFHIQLGDMWTGASTLEVLWAYLVKPSICTPCGRMILSRVHPQQESVQMPPKDVWKDVHTSIVRHSARLETTQMSINSKMNKEIVVHFTARGKNCCYTQQHKWISQTHCRGKEARHEWMNECMYIYIHDSCILWDSVDMKLQTG